MTEHIEGLAERLKSLEADLLPYADKTVGSIRIDLNEVRAICGAAATITELRAENARLREEAKECSDWQTHVAQIARATLEGRSDG